MTTARAMTARSRASLSLVSPNPDSGPVVTAAASVTRVGQQWDELTSGRVSAGMLAVLLLVVMAFYAWTHSIQGGG